MCVCSIHLCVIKHTSTHKFTTSLTIRLSVDVCLQYSSACVRLLTCTHVHRACLYTHTHTHTNTHTHTHTHMSALLCQHCCVCMRLEERGFSVQGSIVVCVFCLVSLNFFYLFFSEGSLFPFFFRTFRN